VGEEGSLHEKYRDEKAHLKMISSALLQ